MSKRKLNRRQTWRAEKIQQERSQRALKKERNLDRQIQSGDLSSEQQGLVICRYSKHFEIQALEGEDQGGIHRCVARANLGTIVAGDKVIWRAGADQTGVIEMRQERRSILERPDNFGKLKPVAANVDQMLIVIACEPAPQPNLIDRYLVAAELMNIRPILVLNKADLICRENRNYIQELLVLYEDLDYTTVYPTAASEIRSWRIITNSRRHTHHHQGQIISPTAWRTINRLTRHTRLRSLAYRYAATATWLCRNSQAPRPMPL